MRTLRILALAAAAFAPVPAQPPDAAYQPLTKAFEALRIHDYDTAIVYFQQAVQLVPGRTDTAG